MTKCTLGFQEGLKSMYVVASSTYKFLANHDIFSSYIVLDQIRQYSLLEPGFPGIIERLRSRLPMSLSELDFSRDV